MMSSLALIVVIVIDQFHMDTYWKYKSQLSQSGIVTLLEHGTTYLDAHHTQFFNQTCPGHIGLSTGAEPSLHGVALNKTFDYGQEVYCLSDDKNAWLHAPEENKNLFAIGTSARRILTSTVNDEVESQFGERSKTVSISIKDRSSIGMAGHRSDLVLWYAHKAQQWTSSTAYAKDLPLWLNKFNEDQRKLEQKRKYEAEEKYQNTVPSVDDLGRLVVRAMQEEKLGSHPKTDLLWVSFSTHDYAGHDFGDDNEKFVKVFKAEDRAISQILAQAKKTKGRILVVLSSDHGAGIDAAELSKKGIPSGKVNKPSHREALSKCFKSEAIGEVGLLQSSSVYIKNLKGDAVAKRLKAKECLKKSGPPYWHVMTKEEVLENRLPQVPWLQNLATSWHPTLGPDVIGVLHPYWNSDDEEVQNHETPYSYDSWVPLSFWGTGVPAKKIYRKVAVTSLAPTLTTLLKIRRPSGAQGPLLEEIVSLK
ncbi:MAG: alkaline phosphatase family protein [Oligoflexia bacterium]|nr:alkaline phosphatase family protein [Oligoflexia bacterium]